MDGKKLETNRGTYCMIGEPGNFLAHRRRGASPPNVECGILEFHSDAMTWDEGEEDLRKQIEAKQG